MKEQYQKRSKSGRMNISDVSMLGLFGHSVHVYSRMSYSNPWDYLHVFRLYMYLHISLNEKLFDLPADQCLNKGSCAVVVTEGGWRSHVQSVWCVH